MAALEAMQLLGAGYDLVQLAGLIAAAFVFSSFYMKTMIPLRSAAIASNVAFLFYSVPLGLWPIAILHGALLPLNLLRLFQLRRLVRRLRNVKAGEFNIAVLMQFMTKQRFPAGHVIIQRGDKADVAYYLASGRVEVPAYGVVLEPGAFFGEIGIFMPDKVRPSTVVCLTDVEVYAIDARNVVSAFTQEPGFAVHLIGLACARMNENLEFFKTQPTKASHPPPGLLNTALDRSQQP
jgi:CRP/FNR family cyclic AMP-dependent transcriptional regulator